MIRTAGRRRLRGVASRAVQTAEFLQKPGERRGGFERYRVVERRTDATNGAMPLQFDQAALRCGLQELVFEIFPRQSEGDVHHRAAVRLRVSPVEALAAIDRLVEQLRLAAVERG